MRKGSFSEFLRHSLALNGCVVCVEKQSFGLPQSQRVWRSGHDAPSYPLMGADDQVIQIVVQLELLLQRHYLQSSASFVVEFELSEIAKCGGGARDRLINTT